MTLLKQISHGLFQCLDCGIRILNVSTCVMLGTSLGSDAECGMDIIGVVVNFVEEVVFLNARFVCSVVDQRIALFLARANFFCFSRLLR